MSEMDSKKILILGGTKEAAELASKLVLAGHDVITSLAGRTKEPKPVAGKTRIGGFGGAIGLADYLLTEKIKLLIDATHPFAKQISQNAFKAATEANVPLEVQTREPWKKQNGDNWIEVSSLEEAIEAMPPGARVLLALGSQYIDAFSARDDIFYLVRMVDSPEENLTLPNHKLIIGRPSMDWKIEKDMLIQNRISHVLCRNSGGKGAYAKIEAARELSLPVIVINR